MQDRAGLIHAKLPQGSNRGWDSESAVTPVRPAPRRRSRARPAREQGRI